MVPKFVSVYFDWRSKHESSACTEDVVCVRVGRNCGIQDESLLTDKLFGGRECVVVVSGRERKDAAK